MATVGATASGSARKLESMRIVTGCTTPEQFVVVFHRFCDAKTCFVPCGDTRAVGTALAFSLRLADGTPMLRGTCVVKAAWKTFDSPFKRPGMQLEIRKLTADSAIVFEQLLSQRTAVMPRPELPTDGVVEEPASLADTNEHVPQTKVMDLLFKQGNAKVVTIPSKPTLTERREAPTVPLATLDDGEAADSVRPTVQMAPLNEKRTPGSAIVLPANPLTDFDDGALDQLLTTFADGGEDEIDDLAIPVEPSEPAPLPKPPATSRDEIQTLLGVAPLVPVKVSDAPVPIKDETTKPMFGAMMFGVQREPAPIAAPSRSLFTLHAMSSNERFWFLCALGAVLMVAAIVLVISSQL